VLSCRHIPPAPFPLAGLLFTLLPYVVSLDLSGSVQHTSWGRGRTYVCMFNYTCMCAHVSMHERVVWCVCYVMYTRRVVCICAYIYIYIYLRPRLRMDMYVCKFIRMTMYACVPRYIYLCAYVCTHECRRS
jgi:hypothetical protein